MESKNITVTVDSRLPPVLRELAARLERDDWARYATDDDQIVYYVIGMKAWQKDQDGSAEHNSLTIPHPSVVSTVRERQVHQQVAAQKTPAYYIERALSRLETSGVPAAATKTFLKSWQGTTAPDLSAFDGLIAPLGSEGFDAFFDLLETLVMARGLDPDEETTEATKSRELRIAVQKLYLGELARAYEKIVARASTLDALEFADPHLNEASRCFVYGFFRAAVVLSGSAVENALLNALSPAGRELVNKREGRFFDRLVNIAVEEGVFGPSVHIGSLPMVADHSRRVLKARNSAAHGSGGLEAREATEVLTLSREVVEFVKTRRSGTAPR